jgi:hypothetical protein
MLIIERGILVAKRLFGLSSRKLKAQIQQTSRATAFVDEQHQTSPSAAVHLAPSMCDVLANFTLLRCFGIDRSLPRIIDLDLNATPEPRWTSRYTALVELRRSAALPRDRALRSDMTEEQEQMLQPVLRNQEVIMNALTSPVTLR